MSILQSLFNHTFFVERPVKSSDGHGGWSASYVVIGSVQGRMRPASGSEKEIAKSFEYELSHVFYTDTSFEYQRGDRILLGDDLVVEVRGIRNPSNADHHYEIDCLERQKAENGSSYGR